MVLPFFLAVFSCSCPLQHLSRFPSYLAGMWPFPQESDRFCQPGLASLLRQKDPSAQVGNVPVLPVSPCHHYPSFLGRHGRCQRAGWALTTGSHWGRAASPALGPWEPSARAGASAPCLPCSEWFQDQAASFSSLWWAPTSNRQWRRCDDCWGGCCWGWSPAWGHGVRDPRSYAMLSHAIKKFFPQYFQGINNFY